MTLPHSRRSYAEKNGVTIPCLDRWIKKRDNEGICINPKTGEKFKYIEKNYLKLIEEL